MFVWTSHESMNALWPAAFAHTNVLFGIVGYRAALHFVRQGDLASANTLWSGAYWAMFSILGLGFRRFFYAGSGADWEAGVVYPLGAFFSSRVCVALLLMAVPVLPGCYYPIVACRQRRTLRYEFWTVLLRHVLLVLLGAAGAAGRDAVPASAVGRVCRRHGC